MSASPQSNDQPAPPQHQKRGSVSIDQPGTTTAPPRKRRARYVWRACDVCRRRKGRCDGRKPCDFCSSRNQECRYTSESDPPGGPAAPTDEPAHAFTSVRTDSLTNGDSVSRLVLALQAQLETLAAHVESCNHTQIPREAPIDPALSNTTASLESQVITAPAGDGPLPTMVNLARANSVSIPVGFVANSPPKNGPLPRRFYGPTSPDYSLNAAEIALRQTQASLSPGEVSVAKETNPSLEDEDDEDDQQHTASNPTGPASQSWAASHRLRQCVAQLPRLLARNEALRLLRVYQNVIGDLHPVLEIGRIAQQVEACYNQNRVGSPEPYVIQDNTILVIFLILAIALAAESVTQSYVGKTLHKSVENLINIKLTSEMSSLDNVLIALLAAICHFFYGERQLAWRGCGMAGRLAMELGLHRKEVHQQLSDGENEYINISVLLWSIWALDRQWSAATGLPHNFQITDFDLAGELPDHAWYMKAMISYSRMSPKFERPICHVASGGTYEQDDAFEVLNFQVDQWLKKAIDGRAIFHPCPSGMIGARAVANSPEGPSSIATILYLRANTFRSIILRPFFLPGIPSHVSVKMVKPSMAIIADTLGVLSFLDSTTDIYRNQHPFCQHFLHSFCALLFLVVAYVRADRNRSQSMQLTDLPEPFPVLVKREVDRALALCTAYSSMSHNSNRLARRLRHLQEQLARPDFLQHTGDTPIDQSQSQRFGQNLLENGSITMVGTDNILLDPIDIMHAMDESIGEEGLSGSWWNDIDLSWSNWAASTEITGHWL